MASRRPSSARPSISKRGSVDQSSRGSQDNLEFECKAAYLVVFDGTEEKIETRKQLIEVLHQAGRNPTRKVLKKYWTNDTESISFEEFVDICRKEKPTSEDELLQAFRKIDTNGDGYIDNAELKKVLTTRGDRMSTEEVQEIIDEVDENKDGKLDYKEFCKMMLETQEQCKKLAVEFMEKKTKKKQIQKSVNDKTNSGAGGDNNKEEEVTSGKEDIKEENEKGKKEGSEKEEEDEIRDETKEDEEEKKPDEKRNEAKEEVNSEESEKKDEDSDEDDSSDDDIVFGTMRSNVSSRKDKFGSQTSVKSSVSQSVKKTGSTTSLRSTRSNSVSQPSPRVKERSKSPIASKGLKLAKPKRLKEWYLSHSKGCFFFDDNDKIVSHQYEMRVSKDTSVWITIEPLSIRPGNDLVSSQEMRRAPVDTMLIILRSDNTLVTFTEERDVKGKYAVRCDLERGVYKLIPFTTGCRFKPRTSEPTSETKLVKRTDDKYVLTKAFKEALNNIFEMCDLDGNGCLSRSEFTYFNLRTSGEEVTDKEWEVVESTLDLKDGEITPQGFIKLNQMEADDNEGDTEELWVTLSNMGFSKSLKLDEAVPFVVDVYSEACAVKLKVVSLDVGGRALDEAVVDLTVGKGEPTKIRNMRDLFLHTYMNNFRTCLVIENKSHHSVKVSVDSSRSDNCTPNTASLENTVTISPGVSVVAQHLMPTNETKSWTVRTQENVIK